MKKSFVIFLLLGLLSIASQGVAQESFLVKVSPITTEGIKLLAGSGVNVYAKTADYYLAEASSENLEYLENHGISFMVLDDKPDYSLYFFVWTKPGGNISKYLDEIKEKATVLEAGGDRAIVKGHPRRIQDLTSLGLRIKLIRKRPLPLAQETEIPARSKGKVPSYNHIINSIIHKVNTNELYNWVAGLSGEYPVTIGGVLDTLFTRYTFTDKCDRAAQFIKEGFERIGLTAWYDTCFVPEIFPYYVMDIVSRPSGDTAWLGCVYSGVWKTTDAGKHWNNISGTDTCELWALSAPAPETLYGVGNYGVVIKSVDDGETWTQLSSPTSQDLRGVYFENGHSGWITGCIGTIYYTNDGGGNWTNQSTGSGDLFEITFVDDSTGWVVGQNGRILKTVNRGTNWTTQQSGTTENIYGVDFATPNKGWVCGQSGYLGYTSDAGANWVSQTSGATKPLYMVSAPDSFHVWAAGIGGTVLNTNDGGTNWISKIISYGDFYEAYFLDARKGWVTGYNQIRFTEDGGGHWFQQMNNIYPNIEKYNVVAELPGQTERGKECLITAHYDSWSDLPYNNAPGADDNASGTAAVLTAAHILKDYHFDYTIKFIGFVAEEEGAFGSEAYAQKAYETGDSIVGVYNLDMIAYDGNNDNVMELHAGTRPSSGALADVLIGVIKDYGLPLAPQKITSGSNFGSDHASFWSYDFPAIWGIEDFQDFNPYDHTPGDRISQFNLPYFTAFAKAGIASLAILAQPVPYVSGDANGDSLVTVSDVIYLINYLFKSGPPPNPSVSADANCDGILNVSDVVYIINYIFKDGLAPAC